MRDLRVKIDLPDVFDPASEARCPIALCIYAADATVSHVRVTDKTIRFRRGDETFTYNTPAKAAAYIHQANEMVNGGPAPKPFLLVLTDADLRHARKVARTSPTDKVNTSVAQRGPNSHFMRKTSTGYEPLPPVSASAPHRVRRVRVNS